MAVPYAEVIGDPIAHSKSPLIHKFWMEKLGFDGDYRAVRVTRDGLATYIESRRNDSDWRGCNVTMPLKIAVRALLDAEFEATKATEAVNTVLNLDGKLAGNNTDLRGFAEPFRKDFSDRGPALVIGAGGAARAIFIALAGLGFGPIQVMARRPEQINFKPMRRVALPFNKVIPTTGLLVNASPLGMSGAAAVDFDLSALSRASLVYDIVYEPLETPLLAAARARGLRTIDGLSMLIGQAAYAFAHFFSDPPRQHDADLRELLTR